VSSARRTLNLQQARELVGVCRRTIYNWLKAGKVEAVRTAGGSVRIYEDSLFTPYVAPTNQKNNAPHVQKEQG
jgi:excisionase family DNA binding protein